jgi:hypothetical protein
MTRYLSLLVVLLDLALATLPVARVIVTDALTTDRRTNAPSLPDSLKPNDRGASPVVTPRPGDGSAPDRRPVVLAYCTDCKPCCDHTRQEIDKRAAELPFRVEWRPAPSWVDRTNSEPCFHWQRADKSWWRYHTSSVDLLIEHWKPTQNPPTPRQSGAAISRQPTDTPATAARRGASDHREPRAVARYQRRSPPGDWITYTEHGQQYTFTEQSLREHLIEEHGYTADQLQGRSFRELIDMHSDAHNGYSLGHHKQKRPSVLARLFGGA